MLLSTKSAKSNKKVLTKVLIRHIIVSTATKHKTTTQEGNEMRTYRIYYGQNCYTSEWYCEAASEEEAKEAFRKTHTSATIINIEVCEN